MKKIIYILLVLPLFLYSCESNPEAHFYTDTAEPVVGQEVFFNNDSHNADKFEWDFGDGYVSYENSPGHIFNSTGSFEVTLTAISKSGLDDKASLTLNVVVPTLLVIEVREYYKEYVVPDASVILYSSITDWDANDQQKKVLEGFTDANGIAVFSNLDPFVYYVDVWESTHDNYALRNEDVGFIRTPEVLPHQINWFVAWVDKVDHGKGIGRGAKQMIIKKLERISTDKRQSAPAAIRENWQELYKKSAGRK